jgi:hypothetical protein
VSVRTRKYVALAVNVLLAVAVTQVGGAAGWTTAQTYAVAGGVLVAFLLVALPWIDLAPDGALRRRPRR